MSPKAKETLYKINLVMAGVCGMAAFTGFRGEHVYLVGALCLLVGWTGLSASRR
jgi:hypothetical protein